MLSNKRLIIFFLSVFVLESCDHSQQTLSISPLPMLDIRDSLEVDGIKTFSRADYYLVKGFRDTKNSELIIDSFVARKKAGDLDKYSNYAIVFFKESSQTNERNIIESQKKVIDRYSNDHDAIYEYDWNNGKFLTRFKIKNGLIVSPNHNIKVIDVPNH